MSFMDGPMVDPYAKENYNVLSLLDNDHSHNSNDRNLDSHYPKEINHNSYLFSFAKWRTLLCLPWKYIIFKYVWSWALSKSGHYLIIYIVLKKNKGILKVYKLVLYQNTFCPFFYYYYTYIILSLYSNFKAAMIVVLN